MPCVFGQQAVFLRNPFDRDEAFCVFHNVKEALITLLIFMEKSKLAAFPVRNSSPACELEAIDYEKAINVGVNFSRCSRSACVPSRAVQSESALAKGEGLDWKQCRSTHIRPTSSGTEIDAWPWTLSRLHGRYDDYGIDPVPI